MKRLCLLIVLVVLSGCKGSTGGGGNSNSSITSAAVISASQVETAKLQTVLKNDPAYKLQNSEIELLQKEGVITAADKTKLQALQ